MVLFCTVLFIRPQAQIAHYDAQLLALYEEKDIQEILNWVSPSLSQSDIYQKTSTIISNQKLIESELDNWANAKDEAAKNSIVKAISAYTIKIKTLQNEIDAQGNHLPDAEVIALKNVKEFLNDPFSQTLPPLDLAGFRSAIQKHQEYEQKKNNGDENGLDKQLGFIGGGLTALPALAGSLIPLISGSGKVSPDLQSKILDGLATYFAEEFKKGRMIAFQQVFEKTFGQVGEFQVLFPETYQALKQSDPLKFPEMGDDLKKVFARDFLNLLDNLMAHIDENTSDVIDKAPLRILNQASCQLIKKSTPYPYLKFGADISSRLINRMPLYDLFPYLDEKYYKEDGVHNSAPKDAAQATELLGDLSRIANLLQAAIRYQPKEEEENQRIWIPLEDLADLNTDREMELFIALIYQQDRHVFNKWLGNPGTAPAAIKAYIKKGKDLVRNLLPILSELQEMAESSEKESVDFARSLDLVLEFLIKEDQSLGTNLFDAQTLHLIQTAVRTYQSFVSEDFDNITENTLEILTILLAQANVKDTNEDFIKVLNSLIKYSEFMESVVEAENNQDMSELIRRHAAEPSSFVLKRNHPFTLSVTGHPGIYLGGETKRDTVSGGFSAGITAPLGLEATFGLTKKRSETPLYDNESKGSIGIYAQVLDIGAIMNFRTGDSTSALPDTITFKQVFSPGLSLNYGFPNSGVSLGLGWQMSPELRKVNPEKGSELRAPTNRFFVRLSWDLPLLNIAKRERSVVKW